MGLLQYFQKLEKWTPPGPSTCLAPRINYFQFSNLSLSKLQSKQPHYSLLTCIPYIFFYFRLLFFPHKVDDQVYHRYFPIGKVAFHCCFLGPCLNGVLMQQSISGFIDTKQTHLYTKHRFFLFQELVIRKGRESPCLPPLKQAYV